MGAAIRLGVAIVAIAFLRSASADECPLKRGSDGQVQDIDIYVQRDGSVIWNGKKLKDEAELDHCFDVIIALKPAPKFHLRHDPATPIMYQVSVMKSAQRAHANAYERSH